MVPGGNANDSVPSLHLATGDEELSIDNYTSPTDTDESIDDPKDFPIV